MRRGCGKQWGVGQKVQGRGKVERKSQCWVWGVWNCADCVNRKWGESGGGG